MTKIEKQLFEEIKELKSLIKYLIDNNDYTYVLGNDNKIKRVNKKDIELHEINKHWGNTSNPFLPNYVKNNSKQKIEELTGKSFNKLASEVILYDHDN